MLLEKLYSRRTDGSIQQWEIEVEGDSYKTISGIKDGSLVESEWTQCQGKNLGKANETSPEQQAMAEAKAKHKKKIENKYSLDINNVDNHEVFKPTLAKNFGDYKDKLFHDIGLKKETSRIYVSPKLDGLRGIATKGGLFSRNGKRFVSVPHIEAALAPIFEKYPTLVLDGECYNHDLRDDFNEICSCIKKQKPKPEDLIKSSKIQYHIFDCVSTSPYSDRLAFLRDNWYLFDNSDSVQLVDTFTVDNLKELYTLYEAFVGDGYEGLMLRSGDKGYENKRTSSLLKVKEFQDDEFEILDIVEGKGNRSGICGYMCFERNGVPFTSNVKGDRAFLRELLSNKDDYIGKQATVKYFNLTPDKQLPRFPCVVKIDRGSVE